MTGNEKNPARHQDNHEPDGDHARLASPLAELAAARYVSVRTFRRSGEPVATPIWPAVIDGKLYFGTPEHTHKVTRLRREARVQFAVCDMKGEVSGDWLDGTARLLEVAEFAPFRAQLDAKFGFQARLMHLFARLRRWHYIGVEITPQARSNGEAR